MRGLKELELLGNIHNIIKNKKKGSVISIANSLNISKSCLYKYIEEIKLLGGEVAYSRQYQHFYYINDFSFQIKIITSEMEEIFGGKMNYFLPSTIKRLKDYTFDLSNDTNGHFNHLVGLCNT